MAVLDLIRRSTQLIAAGARKGLYGRYLLLRPQLFFKSYLNKPENPLRSFFLLLLLLKEL